MESNTNAKEFSDKELTDAEYFHIWTLLRNIAHMMGRIRNEELSQYGVTMMQSHVIYMVKALGENATPKNLAKWLFREPPTISDSLSRMERQGLIRKVPLNNRGQLRIVLTEVGEEAYLHSTLRASIQKIMSRIPPEECRQLRALLLDIRGSVKDYLELNPEDTTPPQLPRDFFSESDTDAGVTKR